jgi:hypothetical protein
LRRASKDGSERKRRSFKTPRKRAAPLDDGGTWWQNRHCEERSDEAIQFFRVRDSGLLRFARNDDYPVFFAQSRAVPQLNPFVIASR